MIRIKVRGIAAAAAIASVVAWSPVAGAEGLEIEDFDVARLNGGWSVSYRVAAAFDEDVIERIESGFPVTFRHRLELVARRAVPLWPSKVVSECTLTTTATYDSLTREYHLIRTREEKPAAADDEDPPDDGEEKVTGDIDEVRSWMTEIDGVVLRSDPKGNRSPRQRLRVTSVVGRKFVFLIFPSNKSASAERHLEP